MCSLENLKVFLSSFVLLIFSLIFILTLKNTAMFFSFNTFSHNLSKNQTLSLVIKLKKIHQCQKSQLWHDSFTRKEYSVIRRNMASKYLASVSQNVNNFKKMKNKLKERKTSLCFNKLIEKHS